MHERYAKQMLLNEFGEEGQWKLSRAGVLVIGAGGLGCPALLYLAAAGIGRVGIVDFDTVDVSNLHRQVLYGDADIGKSKAITAATKIQELNPGVQVNVFDVKLEAANAWEIVQGYDVVIDGSDNFATRFLVNDACMLLGKPLVHGAVFRFEGQVGVFNHGPSPANYRDVFPSIPDPSTIADCNEAGVLGVLPGIIGTMMAAEAIKIIAGIGNILANRLLLYNALRQSFFELKVVPGRTSPADMPKTRSELEHMNYEFSYCSREVPEITCEEFERMLSGAVPQVIDVRDNRELPAMESCNAVSIPLVELNERIAEVDISGTVVVFCMTGRRSTQAVELIATITGHSHVLSLKGGMVAWQKHVLNKTVSI